MEMDIDYDVSDPEAESSDWTGTFTWRVENWTELTEQRIYSPEFEIGGYLWRLIVVPKGYHHQRAEDHIAAYLDFQEVAYTHPQMCPKVTFELIAVNIASPCDSLRLDSTHTFTGRAANWGFTLFLPLLEAQNPEYGFLVNDTLTLRVNIYIRSNHLDTMSRLQTGFVGIKGSDKTSLLSSYLQCMFHIKAIRKAVFQMATLSYDDPHKSLPIALQHLFYKLKYWNTSVETKDIVTALDWDFNDMHLPYDVFEIQHMLFGKLCEEEKAGSVMDCISQLFIGEYSISNESPTMSEAPMHKQSYMGVTLDILECRDIYNSLEKFCQIDRLEEDDRGRKISQGLVQSKHYALFDSFPTVLLFNLKRFHYNPDRNVILKINAHYKFYDELDLDYDDRVLLSENADRTIENKYILHSVLVCAGGPNEGHYSAFIQRHENWYKFDNELVKAVSSMEAINGQFGDQSGTSSANFSRAFESINKSEAVMLVYVRITEWQKVMCDATKKCLPKHIRMSFDKERWAREEQQRERKEAHLYVNIKLATEFHFASQIGEKYYFDLVDFDSVKNYRILKKTPFEGFKEIVSKDFGIPKQLQRFWLWNKRRNNTLRISKSFIEEVHELQTVLDLRDFRDKSLPHDQEENALMTIKLFLETPEGCNPGDGFLHRIQEHDLLIFVKYFDPVSMELSYLGHLFIDKTSLFHLIFHRAKKMARLGRTDEVIGFKEVAHLPEVICEGLLPQNTPEQYQLVQGDIIIIQKLVSIADFALPSVKEFLESVQPG